MAGMTFSPMTMQAILASLPDIKKKQRRAEQLRGSQKEFKELAKKPGQGNYQPQQMGGLFPTVQQYQTDYGAMGNQMTGALGDYMMGRQAEGAEDEYSAAQASGLLGASQQMAGLDAGAQQQDERPSEDTLRLYMGMIGGPDMKDFLPKARGDLRTQSTHKLANGNLGIVTNDPNRPIIDTGVPFDYAVDVKTSEVTGRDYTVGKSGAGRGVKGDVIEGGSQPQAGSAPSQGQFQPMDREELHRRQQFFESGGNPNAVSPAGARGPMQIMPETAGDLAERMGVTVDQILNDPKINEAAGRLYFDDQLQAFGGDQEAALIAYNAGPENAKKWLAAGRNYAALPKPEETQPYVQRILGDSPIPQTGPATATPAVPSAAGSGIAIDPRQTNLTPAQKAQLAVEEAARKKANESNIEVAQKARISRGKMKDISTPAMESLDVLLKHKGLKKILAGGLGSYAHSLGQMGGDKGKGLIASLSRPGYAQYDPEGADALNLLDQVIGGAFATGFQSLVGQGAGSISDAEGKSIQSAITSLSTASSEEGFNRAAEQLKRTIAAIDARLAKDSSLGGPQAPAGGGTRTLDDILKLYPGQ